MVSNIFSPSNLLQENFDTKRLMQDVHVEETYLFNTLKFLSESKAEFRNYSRELYKSILESDGNIETINESFGDFFGKVKDIIDKFLNFIKTLVAKFITGLNGLFKSDKYLNNHKDQLNKFTSDHEFDMDLYEFDHLDDSDIPKSNAMREFKEEYEELSKALDSVTRSDNQLQKIQDVYTEFTNKLQGEFYDNFRKDVIGVERPISSSDFVSELFSLFRSDSSDKTSTTITNTIVSEALLRFQGYNDLIKSVNKTKTNIERDYEGIKKNVSSMIYRNKDNKLDLSIDGNTTHGSVIVSNDVMSKIDLFVKAKVDQVTQMSSIHGIALSAKLDAINDCFKQDKTILYKALYKVQGVVVQDKSNSK